MIGRWLPSLLFLQVGLLSNVLAQTSLLPWMGEHPDVARAVRWEGSRGRIPWELWSSEKKRALETEVTRALASMSDPPTPVRFSDPPLNRLSPQGREMADTLLSETDAWQLYLGHLAQALALEISHRLPWSLESYDATELALLLDSRSFFRWDPSRRGYALDFRDNGLVLPAPAKETYGFLVQNHLIGSTRYRTILNLIDWASQLRHQFVTKSLIQAHYHQYSAHAMEALWQYNGYPPLGRVLRGTHQTLTTRYPGIEHWTAGCWGTTGFFKAVLRVVNIPVRQQIVGGHSQPHFPSERRYLSHGDDPYNALVLKTPPPRPIEKLLLPETTWPGWFSDPWSASRNIGIGPALLAVSILPEYLVTEHRESMALGLAPADSLEFQTLSSYFSLTALVGRGFWRRLGTAGARFFSTTSPLRLPHREVIANFSSRAAR